MHLWRSIMWLLASNRVRGEFWWAVLLGQQEGRARLSRPSLVIFSLLSVAGGSGTSEELQCRGVRPLLRFRAVVSVFLPFRCLRASAGLLNVGIGCYDTEMVARRCSYAVRRRRGRAPSSWYSWVVS